MIRRIKEFSDSLMDSERDFRERLFLLLTFITASAVGLALICDILTHENIVEIMVLFLVLVGGPAVALTMVRMKKTRLGATIVAYMVVLLVLPTIFFFGGGLSGGAIMWFTFAYLFIGQVLDGLARRIAFYILNIMVIALYLAEYHHPELVTEHSRAMWFADSAISVILVGVTVYLMVWFQSRLYKGENDRVIEQAREIEELNKAQNRFFSSMSHEIRTPINSIIGFNEMILREDVSEEVAEDARNIESSSRILLSLINDILDMSKMESGRMEIVNAPYDVEKSLAELVQMISVRTNEKGLDFVVDVDPSMPSQLFSDEMRIRQILINILNNAVKYTSEGSVVFSVHCRKTGEGSALVTYSVEDSGMGIRKESIPYLFDAFRREDVDKNQYIEGTGLGLSIVKQLVELLGGEVSVYSVYTKGSTFVVSLEQEIVDETVIGKFDPEHYHVTTNKKKYQQSFEAPDAKVLIVDDNSSNLLVATKLLRNTKVQIQTADSGNEALSLTAKNHYHIILMDHMMPKMDGVETLHAIREQFGGMCRETPIVALTANAGSENQEYYRREGFDGYLLKPVEASLLEDTLMSLLPEDLVNREAESETKFGSDTVVREMRRKVPLLITTDSISDLPAELQAQNKIPILPYKLYIDGAVFTDGLEATGDVTFPYFDIKNQKVNSEPPQASDYEEFFAEQLTKAQHIIHICMARRLGNGYANACEAALSFYNVKVVDSGHFSSGTGMMALLGRELAEAGHYDTESILEELLLKREKIRTCFIVDNPVYLFQGGKIPEWIYELCTTLLLHPMMDMKDSGFRLIGLLSGNLQKARERFVRKMLANPEEIDPSVLFINYSGMRRSEVENLKEIILSILPFEQVYLQKTSPAIAVNCGPNSIGLVFARK